MCLGTNADSRLKSRVLGKVVAYGDECLGNESVGKREDEIDAHPSGNQAVPIIEPDWNSAITWLKKDRIRAILSCVFLKDSGHAKTLCQIGLDRLRETFYRFTEIDP